MGVECTKPLTHTIVNLPDLTTIEALMGNEEIVDTPLNDDKDDGLVVDLTWTLKSIHNTEIFTLQSFEKGHVLGLCAGLCAGR